MPRRAPPAILRFRQPEDGLAFSREERVTWRIQVMNLRTAEQAQLTNADCDSVSPVWTPDSKNLIDATDCGRVARFDRPSQDQTLFDKAWFAKGGRTEALCSIC